LIYITAAEIFSAIEHRNDFYRTIDVLLQSAAQCLAQSPVSGKKLAWATAMNSVNLGSIANFDQVVNFTSTSGALFGHVPAGSLDLSSCPGLSPSTGWWPDWQDQFFYALAKGQSPSSPVGDCTDDVSCLTVQVVGTTGTAVYDDIAAIVLFGGKKLPLQTRSESLLAPIPTAWLDRANFLEEDNAINTNPGPTGGKFIVNSNPQDVANNDRAYCIKADLTVIDCTH
jgi:hypothetical protein